MVISLIVSMVGGLLFVTSFVPLAFLLYKLVRRERPNQQIYWLLFVAVLYIGDLVFTRKVFLEFSQERIIRRAQPLITAIGEYRLDSGTYPIHLDSLVPEYIEQLPKPTSREWDNFKYENLDSTYQFGFNQRVAGRTYRGIVYTPTGTLVVPEYASSDAHDTGHKNWKYYYY